MANKSVRIGVYLDLSEINTLIHAVSVLRKEYSSRVVSVDNREAWEVAHNYYLGIVSLHDKLLKEREKLIT